MIFAETRRVQSAKFLRTKARFDLVTIHLHPRKSRRFCFFDLRDEGDIRKRMRMIPDRAVLTIAREDGVWRVEHEGETFGHSREKEVARAAAVRRAREMQDNGQACELRVSGEHGFGGG